MAQAAEAGSAMLFPRAPRRNLRAGLQDVLREVLEFRRTRPWDMLIEQLINRWTFDTVIPINDKSVSIAFGYYAQSMPPHSVNFQYLLSVITPLPLACHGILEGLP